MLSRRLSSHLEAGGGGWRLGSDQDPSFISMRTVLSLWLGEGSEKRRWLTSDSCHRNERLKGATVLL